MIRYRLDVENHQGQTVAIIPDFLGLTYSIGISKKAPAAQLRLSGWKDWSGILGEDYIVRVWRIDTVNDSVWRNVTNLIVKTPDYGLLPDGGRSYLVYLAPSEELVDKEYIVYPAGSPQASKEVVHITTAMNEFVRENVGDLATVANGRAFDDVCPVTVGSTAVGPAWQRGRAGKHLLTTLMEMVEYSRGIGDDVDFRMVYQGGYAWVFECGKLGTDRRIGNLAGIPAVRFSALMKNLTSYRVTKPRYNEANVVVAMGYGTGEDRIVEIAQVSQQASPISRRCKVVQVNTASPVSAAVAAQANLEEMVADINFSAQPSVRSTYVIFRDYQMGDYVTFEDEQGNLYDRQWVEATIRVAPAESGGAIETIERMEFRDVN